MKLLIASDIHGSAYYCGKLMQVMEQEQPDKLLLLGDLLYHGPRNDLPRDYAPKAVIPMLSAHQDKIIAVRGNCEAEVDQMVLPFPILADYAVIPAGERLIYLSHGHKFGETTPPPFAKGDILLGGHTHVAKIADHGDYVYLNPGSVSIPKENTPQGYILFDGETFLFKKLDGTIYNKYSL